MGRVRTSLLAATLIPVAFSLAACDDNRKVSEQSAADALATVAPLLKDDVTQVKRGLPEGAQKIGPMLDPDTVTNLITLQKAITRTRNIVHDLEVAKSTFFAYTDPTGKVLRSEADLDLLAEKPLFPSFPALRKAAEPGAGFTETWGEMKELRSAKTGPDLIWAAAMPVKDDKGQVKGLFVTGWSLRALAYHLETSLKMSVAEASQKAGKKNPPIIHVYVIKGKTAYGTPDTPVVNAKAVEDQDAFGKCAAGPYRGTVDITGRPFGLAASRAPEVGDDAAVAVLASDI